MKLKHCERGFTLIEMLLVMVIVAMVIYASIGYIQQRSESIRIDRTTMQMQQLLNAALSYYVVNGKWPSSLQPLLGGYIPNVKPVNPWGVSYQGNPLASSTSTPQNFYVYTTIPGKGTSAGTAKAVAALIPFGMAVTNPPTGTNPCTATSPSCGVVGMVNIPGQDLNNATAVNFAGLYHHGGCVPVPQCPRDGNGNWMTAEVIVVPVSVSGVTDTTSNTPAPNNVYPISSFTAYATDPSTNPDACSINAEQVGCNPTVPCQSPPCQYWRACLSVTTENGEVSSNPGTGAWGQYVTLLAFTRCSINGEPAGSGFNVFSN